jgi:hypothetical protein
MYLVQLMEIDWDWLLVNCIKYIVLDEFYSTKNHICHCLIHVELVYNFQVMLRHPINNNKTISKLKIGIERPLVFSIHEVEQYALAISYLLNQQLLLEHVRYYNVKQMQMLLV